MTISDLDTATVNAIITQAEVKKSWGGVADAHEKLNRDMHEQHEIMAS